VEGFNPLPDAREEAMPNETAAATKMLPSWFGDVQCPYPSSRRPERLRPFVPYHSIRSLPVPGAGTLPCLIILPNPPIVCGRR
jgi:hypothetical protein